MLVGPEFIKPTSPESFQGPKHRGWTLLVIPRNPRDVTLGHPGSLTRVRERSPDSRTRLVGFFIPCVCGTRLLRDPSDRSARPTIRPSHEEPPEMQTSPCRSILPMDSETGDHS